jgi:PAS domain S-box-containing protein
MIGYEQEEINPSIDEWKNLLHPEDRIIAEEALLKCIKNQTDLFEKEIRFRKNDGSFLWILVRGQVIKRGESGEILRMAGTHTDISERKIFEASLKESRQLLREIFDFSLEFIGVLSVEGIVLDINRTALDFIGARREDVINSYFWDTPFWIHSVNEQLYQKNAVLMAANGEVIRFNTTLKSKDGTIHLIDFSIKPVKDETGKIIFIIPEGRDITELSNAAKEMEEWKKRYELVSSASGQVIYDCNFVKNQITWGGSIEKVLGYKLSEMDGTFEQWEQLINPDDRERVLDYYDLSVKNLTPFYTEYGFRHKDGHYVPVIDKGFIMTNADGKPESIVGMMQDMTKHRQMENELMAKNRELSEFTMKVSHDLKSPLNIIRGFLEAIKEEPELFEEYYERTIKRITDLIEFVDNMLKLSRAGRIIDIQEELDLDTIIKTVFEKFSPESSNVELNIIQPFSMINGDPAGIEQVFSNLIQNSIRYRDYEKQTLKIEVGCVGYDSNIIINYKDNGSGIDPENLDKVFNLGFTTGSNIKGTGIGLTIVKKVISAHGGKVRVSSAGKGKGVEFEIILPK